MSASSIYASNQLRERKCRASSVSENVLVSPVGENVLVSAVQQKIEAIQVLCSGQKKLPWAEIATIWS